MFISMVREATSIQFETVSVHVGAVIRGVWGQDIQQSFHLLAVVSKLGGLCTVHAQR